MEALFYLSDLLATVLLMYWAAKHAGQSADSAADGLFGYKQMLNPTARLRAEKPVAGPGRRGAARIPQAPGTAPKPSGTAPNGGWREPSRRDPASREPGRRHPGRRDPAR